MPRPKLIPNAIPVESTVTPVERIYLAALRDILPQLSTQSDEYLQKRIEKNVGKDKLLDAAYDLEGYINAGTTGTLLQNERIALATKLLRFLSQYIQEMNPPLPVTLNTMINSMPLLAASADKNFPGYAGARLLRYAVTPMQQRPVVHA